jgi:hypothetical protein
MNNIVEFRSRRPGPEAEIQEVVEQRISTLFASSLASDFWAGSSLPLGAGIPDLVIASYHREVLALAAVDMDDSEILAYLRVVGRAKTATIAERLRTPERIVRKKLQALLDLEALSVSSEEVFTLATPWGQILREIITIEVKVADWQRALEQAARNRIFAHRSYVAFPLATAERIRSRPMFARLGLGIIGVTPDQGARVVRKARRRQPLVWSYYYKLASLIARNCSD